ncbi:MAG: hypothetical protein ACR2RB_13410 [Gammaproteobacteria bacterium]
MGWVEIGTAAFLVVMLAFLIPRAGHMLRNSPKAESGDWQSAILPIGGVVAFVALLLWLVSN